MMAVPAFELKRRPGPGWPNGLKKRRYGLFPTYLFHQLQFRIGFKFGLVFHVNYLNI